jgi:hypothetical protein
MATACEGRSPMGRDDSIRFLALRADSGRSAVFREPVRTQDAIEHLAGNGGSGAAADVVERVASAGSVAAVRLQRGTVDRSKAGSIKPVVVVDTPFSFDFRDMAQATSQRQLVTTGTDVKSKIWWEALKTCGGNPAPPGFKGFRSVNCQFWCAKGGPPVTDPHLCPPTAYKECGTYNYKKYGYHPFKGVTKYKCLGAAEVACNCANPVAPESVGEPCCPPDKCYRQLCCKVDWATNWSEEDKWYGCRWVTGIESADGKSKESAAAKCSDTIKPNTKQYYPCDVEVGDKPKPGDAPKSPYEPDDLQKAKAPPVVLGPDDNDELPNRLENNKEPDDEDWEDWYGTGKGSDNGEGGGIVVPPDDPSLWTGGYWPTATPGPKSSYPDPCPLEDRGYVEFKCWEVDGNRNKKKLLLRTYRWSQASACANSPPGGVSAILEACCDVSNEAAKECQKIPSNDRQVCCKPSNEPPCSMKQ